jgi:8-oxo-dGTP diphosphatase
MVDAPSESAKNPDAPLGWLPVVAGAVMTPEGLWLMHRRPPGKAYAGLWEFPGGKVEAFEKPLETLIRELEEEIGIVPLATACRPALFAQQPACGTRPEIVLMLYIVDAWQGTPQALEGGEVGWFTPAQALKLPMPPMDRDLAERLWL